MSAAPANQRIEAPTAEDVDKIARQMMHAGALVHEITGSELSGRLADLPLIQRVLDSGLVEPEATYSLHALGMAFGKVFVDNVPDYDFWMVEDEYGRDPALRYKDTTLLVFPQTMISKRIEDGEGVDVRELFDGLRERVEEIRAENHPGA
jgi:hypothetical protein